MVTLYRRQVGTRDITPQISFTRAMATCTLTCEYKVICSSPVGDKGHNPQIFIDKSCGNTLPSEYKKARCSSRLGSVSLWPLCICSSCCWVVEEWGSSRVNNSRNSYLLKYLKYNNERSSRVNNSRNSYLLKCLQYNNERSIKVNNSCNFYLLNTCN